jgi:dTDP-4-amino-4,6-dideoxygalactose transaminase
MPILVTRSSMPPFEEYTREIKDLWDSHWLTNNGEKHKRLEESLKSYLGVDNITLFTNGHLALEAILSVMELSGEVITTPFTFASTTHAIIRNGLKPVFCDIKPGDYTIDEKKIEALISEKTTAIVPVHVYGKICNTEAIEKIAEAHHLKVIYDAAHAFGEIYKGKGIGSYGDASMFSFHATKVFNTIEGGAVVCKDTLKVPALEKIKNFGFCDGEVEAVGGNAKMNEFQAAMGICNLRHLDEEIKKRKVVLERYVSQLSNIPGILVNSIQEGVQPNYAYFPVIFDSFENTRDKVDASLQEQGIFARKYFYPTTNSFPCFKGIYNPKDTPVARYMAERVLTLPLYSDLALDDVDRICRLITECMHKEGVYERNYSGWRKGDAVISHDQGSIKTVVANLR